MQCLRRRIDFRRCLAFLLPPLLLMLYQLLFSEYTSLYPDARLYLSIADNFLHTGHFIQTDRVGVEIVVPFAYPLYITLLRAVGIITDVYSFIGKCLVLAFMPAGYLLSRK